LHRQRDCSRCESVAQRRKGFSQDDTHGREIIPSPIAVHIKIC